MNKRYILRLSVEERVSLLSQLKQKRLSKKKARNIQIILCTDQGAGGKCMIDAQISKAYNITSRTVRNVRKRSVEHGLACGINGKARELSRSRLKVSPEVEEQLVSLSQQIPPEGFSSWSLRLLSTQMVELDYIENISHEKVRQVLKKRR